MKLHYLQHVGFEDPAGILNWAREKNFSISFTRVDLEEKLPSVDSFDWLVVMGGPMNIYEEDKYPWLKEEKEFIKNAITAGKKVLGICLGAQLLADVLGAKITPNREKEIGWFKLKLTPEGLQHPLFKNIEDEFTGFHWHGDTFSLPPQASKLAFTEVCANQAFIFDNRVVGLQFHLETTPASATGLVENCRSELVAGKAFIQNEAQILQPEENFKSLQEILQVFMDNFEGL